MSHTARFLFLLGDTVCMAFKQTNQIQACHDTMSSADSRAGILGDCDGAGPPGRCRVESVESAADLEVTSTRGQPSGGKIMEIDDNLMTLMTLSIVIIH